MAVSAGRPDKHNPVAGVLWMTAAAVCFSAAFVFVKALQDGGMTVFQAVLMRQTFGLLVFMPIIFRRGRREMLASKVRPRHFVRAASAFTGMCSSYYSLHLINLGEAVSLQFTLPIFTAFCAAWLLGEKLRRHRMIATVVGFAGVLVIVRPGLQSLNIGIILALASAVFYAVSDSNARYLARFDATPTIMVHNFAFVIVLSAIPSAIWWVTPSVDLWPVALGFVLSGVAAQYCLTRAYGAAEVGLVAPILFLRLPIVAAVGFVLYGQDTDIWTWVGAGVIFLATSWMAHVETRGAPARQG